MAPVDALPAALLPWQNFYILAGTAAATLTGLMFVAVTFGSSLVTRENAPTSRAFLDPTYHHFVQVLLTACVVTMPVLGSTLLGSLVAVAGLLRLAHLRLVFCHYLAAHRRAGDVELSDWLMAIAVPLACYLSLLAISAGFVLRADFAVTALAVVTLVMLFIGIHGAWELFVWMALAVNERSSRRQDPGA